MGQIENRTDKEKGKEGLSSVIGRMFTKILSRALIIVCMESILIGGCFVIMYILKDNRSSAMEYTE